MKDLEKEYRRVSYILGEVCDYPECIEQSECDYSHETQPTCLHCLMSDALHLIEEQHKLLKEMKNETERNPVIVCPHCGKRVK